MRSENHKNSSCAEWSHVYAARQLSTQNGSIRCGISRNFSCLIRYGSKIHWKLTKILVTVLSSYKIRLLYTAEKKNGCVSEIPSPLNVTFCFFVCLSVCLFVCLFVCWLVSFCHTYVEFVFSPSQWENGWVLRYRHIMKSCCVCSLFILTWKFAVRSTGERSLHWLDLAWLNKINLNDLTWLD